MSDSKSVPYMADLAGKVNKTGDETIEGMKTFSTGIKVDDAENLQMGNTNLKAYIEEAFNYVKIAVNTFTAKNSSKTTFLYGTSIDKINFEWTLNKTAKTITISGPNLTTFHPTTSPQNNIALTSALNPDIPVSGTSTTYKYRIDVTEDTSAGHPTAATANKESTITFCNIIKYGSSTATTATQALIEGLGSESLSGTKNTSFTVNAGSGKYIWFAYPKRLGASKFTVGGFEGGFEAVQTVEFTNANNLAEDYYVYHSTEAGLGSTTFTVANA